MLYSPVAFLDGLIVFGLLCRSVAACFADRKDGYFAFRALIVVGILISAL
jgi:hypothetical protein